MPGLVALVGVEQRRLQLGGNRAVELGQEPPRLRCLLVEREPHAEAELGVVLEERVRPRGAAAVGVRRPRRRRQVAAVDRRAAGRVRDEQPVAEELGQELQVRRLAAAGAGAGELEQRLQHLRALDRRRLYERRGRSPAASRKNSQFSRSRSRCSALRQRVERLVAGELLVLGRADLDADPAAGAVVGRDLDRHRHARQVLRAPLLRAEARGRAGELGRVVDLHPDRRVRADERALGAVDAERLVPDRQLVGEVALLEVGRAEREGAVGGQRAHGQLVALARDQRADAGPKAPSATALVAVRRRRGLRRCRPRAGESRAGSTAAKLRSTISSPRFAYVFAIASLIAPIARLRGQDAGEREEAGLEHGVRRAGAGRPRAPRASRRSRRSGASSRRSAPASRAAAGPRPRRGRTALLSRNVAPSSATASTSIRSSRSNWWQATNCARSIRYERADRPRPEAEVRDGRRAGLLRVVDEVALREAAASARR